MTISLSDALATVLERVAPLASETIDAEAAHGRILARDVVSDMDLPPFANSAMDGFAVRAADTILATPQSPVTLQIAIESRAGVPSAAVLAPGCAARISTGATLPDGADAVLRIEDAAEHEGTLRLGEALVAGHDVRPAGDDITAGTTVLRSGVRLGAGELAMLAAIGRTQAEVRRAPRAWVLTTGDEVVPPGHLLGPGQIHESNSIMLAHLVRESGGVVVGVQGGVADSRQATVDAIRRALDEADVVVLSGGVSMGDHDHVKPALETLGVECHFWQVALRPGHPTWFGSTLVDGHRRLVFALPGNPVSAYISFHLLAAPALAAMQLAAQPRLEIPATYSGPTQHKPMAATLALRCRLDTGPFGALAVLTARNQRSHVIGSLVGVHGLALVPPGKGQVEDGDSVMVRLVGHPGT